MNLADPAYLPVLQEIAQLCKEQNLTPQFNEPKTAPGPRKIYSHADHLSQLIENRGIQIPPEQFSKWRVLSRHAGNLPTFAQTLWILCTDGTVAWFVSWCGEVFLGELRNFSGIVSYWQEEAYDFVQVKSIQDKNAKLDALLEELLA